ncbi:hypothetical protein EB796_007158 [Bugula neritina]|uniref:Uncharacterized protein n=1 Tax=Bugula neritina TaxID=10212 RepID=A0A7J7KAA1_BUGNE|nr:hypothetical protein EB796_007158 [Bugula neritina]
MQTLNREFSHKHVCCRITYTYTVLTWLDDQTNSSTEIDRLLCIFSLISFMKHYWEYFSKKFKVRHINNTH